MPLLLAFFCSPLAAQEFPGWGELVDPVGDCPVDPLPDGIQLTIPAGIHQLNPTMDTVNAPRVWQSVEADFLYEVRVKDFPRPEADSGANGNRSYVAAGIVIWHDENNFLRWTRSASAEKNAVYLSCEQFENGKHVGGGYFRMKDEPIWIRVERRGNTLRMSASDDGKKWQQAIERDCTFPTALKAGVFGLNVTEKEFQFRFSDGYLLK
ncbi:DUF1349 domain-containing protein [Bremerella cremea]|nr:DUF1349 domain-containing protein [Bremerella cremea]